jgi:hypothetical protein
MPIKLKSSGGGDVTLDVPSTASTYTLTIPASTGSVVTADASGNVGLGVSPSSSFKLFVNGNASLNGYSLIGGTSSAASANITGGTTFSTDGAAIALRGSTAGYNNHGMEFYAGGSERARIDSSGNLLVGSTTANAKLYVSGSNAGSPITRIDNAVSPTAASSLLVYTAAAASGSAYQIIGNANGSNTFIVYTNGNVQNSNNSYGGISDQKLKENIVDATPKLDDLMKVKVRSFNFKNDPENTKQIGVVAQELEQVFPGMVQETHDLDEEGNDLGTTTKSVKYSVFVPMLIKAIQELKTELDATKAEVAALKGAV